MKNDIPQVFIVAHGDLASVLLETVETIAGKQDNVNAFSNKEDSLPVLAEKIKQKIEESQTKNIIIFIDLVGGSCWNLANMIRKQYKDAAVIGGVNVPMLISCFMNISEMPFTELVKKVTKDGNRGIYSLIQ
jgi:mannose/fructose/sorbose-specific phosphotransferase system IIA component